MDTSALNKITSIKGMMQKMAPEQISLVRGIVTCEDPLEITAVNDSKLVIPVTRLIVPQWLTDHKYEAHIGVEAYAGSADAEKKDDTPYSRAPSCAHGDCSITPCADHTYKQDWIIIKNHLREGDAVLMLAFNGGKKYYVLDREEGGDEV